jgi:hypothetical protein
VKSNEGIEAETPAARRRRGREMEESTLRGSLGAVLLGGWLVGSRRSARGLLGIEATRVGG